MKKCCRHWDSNPWPSDSTSPGTRFQPLNGFCTSHLVLNWWLVTSGGPLASSGSQQPSPDRAVVDPDCVRMSEHPLTTGLTSSRYRWRIYSYFHLIFSVHSFFYLVTFYRTFSWNIWHVWLKRRIHFTAWKIKTICLNGAVSLFLSLEISVTTIWKAASSNQGRLMLPTAGSGFLKCCGAGDEPMSCDPRSWVWFPPGIEIFIFFSFFQSLSDISSASLNSSIMEVPPCWFF